ncbi:MAG: serine/threonine-protein phosphatase [Porticoccaceae bacterium]|nr:serine/threonine-protein phosphatase [Porticoccaceae bacterium]MBT5578199.1 serine/threonine-protein phosphatase [Porticoccaceae bacterium]MBT7374884.1 serine/threonine-protein phosphatase [Porticoccaceae bacterium]
MSELKGPVILVEDNAVGLEKLQSDLQAVGAESLRVQDTRSLESVCEDPLNQPLVLASPNIPLDTAQHNEELQQLCADYLVIMAIDSADLDQIASYFRLGVADVILPESDENDLDRALARVAELASTRRQTSSYSAELETTNRELQESLRLLKQDQLAGLEVQKSLMPESPLAFGEYEISHSITPSLYLSGDFVGYNFVLDRYLLFYFADVSGHGASSAFVTVLLRFMIGRVIRRHMLEKDYAALAQAPEGLVEHINNQLLATGLGKHLTLVAGSLDTETRELRYVVGAQQPQPILIVDNKAKFLPGKGKPAGIFEDATWVVEQIQLPERFALVLLSDGVYDLLPNKEIAQKERTLLRYLSTSSGNIEQLKEALFIDYIEDPQDDISVLLLTGGMF